MDGYFAWNVEDPRAALTAAVPFFEKNGYAVLTSHATPSETAALQTAATDIMQAFHNTHQQGSIFSTDEQVRAVENDYFLESAGKVHCFFEPNQQANTPKKAINKIGHALHDLHGPFRSFSRSSATKAVASAFGFGDALLVQSMYILKNAFVGAAVNEHRDATFVYSKQGNTSDCIGLWWALQPSTLENGCLWVVPKSHCPETAIRRMLVRDGVTEFDGTPDEPFDDGQYVALPMDPGDVVVLHGGIIHRSLPNVSEKSRHAYSIHLVRGEVGDRCWLSAGKDTRFKPL
ncbi:unnamed protein product [Agarophyton chilense]